jgi:hypothetical protein
MQQQMQMQKQMRGFFAALRMTGFVCSEMLRDGGAASRAMFCGRFTVEDKEWLGLAYDFF